MNKQLMNSLLPHLIAIVIFIAISFIYFSPLLEGKVIQQHDKTTFLGMSKEVRDFREATGEEALWTNSMFGGMPAYLISVKTKSNLIKPIDIFLKSFERPASQVFLCLLGFYISLLIFGVNPWLSLAGAIAFTFSSYFFIIISAGHNTKVFAIAYMSPIIAGIYQAYRGKILLGSAITALFLALQLVSNHLQITYYTLIIVLIFGLVELVYTIKDKTYLKFLKATGILIIVALFAVGSNFSKTLTIMEYGKYSTRGKSELTINKENKTSGLDKDYAMAWSYGISETLTVLIPNFKGGASVGSVGENSASFKFFKKIQGERYASQVTKQLPLYWGNQPGTSGPVYFGAIIMFLFVLGFFILDKKLKWWLISTTVLSVLLSWGHNFSFFSNLFLDYFPGYNKFRVVAMTLVIAQFTVPLMAILALKEFFDGSVEKQKLEKAFKHSFYIIGGIALFFSLFPGALFDFSAKSDQGYIAQVGQAFVDALKEDRKMLLRADAFRSFVFIILSALAIYAFMKKKLKKNYAFAALIVLILIDMWAIDRRYLNNDNFISKRQAKEPYKMSQADQRILQDRDPDFRVLNLTVDPFNDASTSYFHKSIGGYHAAKMKRYQELIEFQISKNNMDVLNMLNTKYFIVPDNNRQPVAQYNAEALGNAWFVEDYRIVPDADSEIQALSEFNPSQEAIVDQRFEDFVQGKNFTKDTESYIKLEVYKPNHLTYTVNCTDEKLVVFSEIYYPEGWKAYIDGNYTDHFRVNYVLRSLVIPEGDHRVEFKFEPESYYIGNKIALAGSSILLLFIIFVFGRELVLFYNKNSK
ncbi:MAG: YfhO family protein [Bacteroidales bacterium]|nr:YfhO family protein [Bacteroidales bacterium]